MDLTDGWKWVVGFETYYKINDAGDVVSVARPGRRLMDRPMTQFVRRDGYVVVFLCGRSFGLGPRAMSRFVHVLVAAAFLGPKVDGQTVNHKNRNKSDNHISNLEYMNQADNNRHGRSVGAIYDDTRGEKNGMAKLKDSDVSDIKRRLTTERRASLASEYGVSTSTIYLISRGLIWRHIK